MVGLHCTLNLTCSMSTPQGCLGQIPNHQLIVGISSGQLDPGLSWGLLAKGVEGLLYWGVEYPHIPNFPVLGIPGSSLKFQVGKIPLAHPTRNHSHWSCWEWGLNQGQGDNQLILGPWGGWGVGAAGTWLSTCYCRGSLEAPSTGKQKGHNWELIPDPKIELPAVYIWTVWNYIIEVHSKKDNM